MRHDWTVWQDERVARQFVRGRRTAIPGVAQQLDFVLRLVGHVGAPAPRVLDLGCGDGFLAEVVLDTFPGSTVVALDGSEAMLGQARERLARFSRRVRWERRDFSRAGWTDGLGAFDAVVSGFAIHHLEDPQKRQVYADVCGMLNRPGVFVNVEHVATRSGLGHEMFDREMDERFARFQTESGTPTTPEQVRADMDASGQRAANRLTLVDVQLGWMEELGLEDVDCHWKYMEMAVLAGFKR